MADRADSTSAPANPRALTSFQIIPYRRGGCPEGVEPLLWRKALSERVRTHLDLATALLGLLDGADGDCYLEDGADLEPSIGGNPMTFDLVDTELDEADNEPWLGWRPMHEYSSQASIAAESTVDPDREDEHDGREPDADLEPSLGSPEIGARVSLWVHDGGVVAFGASQERWANGGGIEEEEAVNEDGDEADTAS